MQSEIVRYTRKGMPVVLHEGSEVQVSGVNPDQYGVGDTIGYRVTSLRGRIGNGEYVPFSLAERVDFSSSFPGPDLASIAEYWGEYFDEHMHPESRELFAKNLGEVQQRWTNGDVTGARGLVRRMYEAINDAGDERFEISPIGTHYFSMARKLEALNSQMGLTN